MLELERDGEVFVLRGLGRILSRRNPRRGRAPR
jgi:hypothetical protein